MKKKLLSLVMACAMILSLAVPAFAGYFSYEEAGTSLNPDGITFAAKTYVPTVSLAMPALVSTSNPVVLNPYKLVYTGTDQTLNDKAVTHDEDKVKQVISPVYAIENKTNVALKFAVKATTTLNSDEFTLATSHTSLTEKAKKAYITLVVRKTAETTAANVVGGTLANLQELDPFDTANNETVVLAAGEKSTQAAQLKKLAAASSSAANYLQFQFQGSMTRSPEIGWTDEDTFTTVLEFTFTPESNQDYKATASLATTTTAANYGKALTSAPAALDPATAFAAGAGTFNTFVSTGSNAAPVVNGAAATKVSDVANTTTPAWSLVYGGTFGATIDASNGKITYPASIGTLLTGSSSGTANTDELIVGFNDANGVPKTIGVTVTITHAISGS